MTLDGEHGSTTTQKGSESLLKYEHTSSRTTYLVKLPEWIAEAIGSCQPGTEIGILNQIDQDMNPSGSANMGSSTLSLTPDFVAGIGDRPSEYKLSATAYPEDLRVFQSAGSSTSLSRVRSVVHAYPTRGATYTALLKGRLTLSDIRKQHRTVHNDDDYSASRNAKLFLRPDASDTAALPSPTPSVQSKRVRGLDDLPQRQVARGAQGSAAPSLEDGLMAILVERDEGWPLQQLSKALKDKGVSAPMPQLKEKLIEICVYERRGEDSHPRYYLKSEYK